MIKQEMKNQQKKIKAVIFDFDGVIVDSYEATIHYMQKTLRHFHKKEPTEKDFEGLLGLKIRNIFKNLLPNAAEKELDKIYEYSRQESIKSIKNIKLIKGARQVLKQLLPSFKLGIASSRSKKSLNIIIDKFELWPFFKTIIGREDVTRHKPHPESLLKALASLHITPKEAVYVGDMKEDILAAKNAGMISILIKKDPRANYNANYTMNNITKIPKVLNEIF